MSTITREYECLHCHRKFYVNADEANEVKYCPFCKHTTFAVFTNDFCTKDITDYDSDCVSELEDIKE